MVLLLQRATCSLYKKRNEGTKKISHALLFSKMFTARKSYYWEEGDLDGLILEKLLV